MQAGRGLPAAREVPARLRCRGAGQEQQHEKRPRAGSVVRGSRGARTHPPRPHRTMGRAKPPAQPRVPPARPRPRPRLPLLPRPPGRQSRARRSLPPSPSSRCNSPGAEPSGSRRRRRRSPALNPVAAGGRGRGRVGRGGAGRRAGPVAARGSPAAACPRRRELRGPAGFAGRGGRGAALAPGLPQRSRLEPGVSDRNPQPRGAAGPGPAAGQRLYCFSAVRPPQEPGFSEDAPVMGVPRLSRGAGT